MDDREAVRRDRMLAYEAAAAPMLEALKAAGLDVSDFGTFTSLRRTTFDYAVAAPILIQWLPQIDEPSVIESIARSLTGEKAARGDGARQLIATFRRLPGETSVKWVIGNALSTLTGPADADDIIELLLDPRHGTARQMLCDSLTRTHDPRAAASLLRLIEDDQVSGHAILALRRIGNWRSIPEAERARPMLEALLARPGSNQLLRKKQALKALETIDRTT